MLYYIVSYMYIYAFHPIYDQQSRRVRESKNESKWKRRKIYEKRLTQPLHTRIEQHADIVFEHIFTAITICIFLEILWLRFVCQSLVSVSSNNLSLFAYICVPSTHLLAICVCFMHLSFAFLVCFVMHLQWSKFIFK